MHVTTIGLDLAKHWFQVHGVDASGAVAVRGSERHRAHELGGTCKEPWFAQCGAAVADGIEVDKASTACTVPTFC
jgi:hypothetical protein